MSKKNKDRKLMLKNVKKNHTDFNIFIAYCGQGFFGKTDKKTFDKGANPSSINRRGVCTDLEGHWIFGKIILMDQEKIRKNKKIRK